MHVPRNAGTTLGRILRLKFGLWPPSNLLRHSLVLGCYHVPGFENKLRTIGSLSDHDKKRVRLFEAHAGYGVHEQLPEPSAYVTMLREPIDRAISVFSYRRQKGDLAPDMTFEHFVRKGDVDRIWWVDNAQVRYLAAEHGEIVDVPLGQCTQTMLDCAIERLKQKFAFFGVVDRFEESIVLLRRTFGFRGCYYVQSNMSERLRARADLPASDFGLLSEYNELDAELYRQGSKCFDETVSNEGESFVEELERFRSANARYTRWIRPIFGVAPRARRVMRRARFMR